MMISPENYYEMNLKDKNAEQIMSAIRGLKREIGHLKDVMEHPDYGKEPIVCPSEATRLFCVRDYLERAKQALIEVGGTYKPSQAEEKATVFDDNISAISKIVFSIGGFFGGHTTRTVLLDEIPLQVRTEHSLSPEPERTPERYTLPMDRDEFLSILSNLYIGEWRTSYNTERFGYMVLDGTQWELEIHYSNGRKAFKSYGSNAYPYNFDAFQELLGIDTTPYEDAGE